MSSHARMTTESQPDYIDTMSIPRPAVPAVVEPSRALRDWINDWKDRIEESNANRVASPQSSHDTHNLDLNCRALREFDILEPTIARKRVRPVRSSQASQRERDGYRDLTELQETQFTLEEWKRYLDLLQHVGGKRNTEFGKKEGNARLGLCLSVFRPSDLRRVTFDDPQCFEDWWNLTGKSLDPLALIVGGKKMETLKKGGLGLEETDFDALLDDARHGYPELERGMKRMVGC